MMTYYPGLMMPASGWVQQQRSISAGGRLEPAHLLANGPSSGYSPEQAAAVFPQNYPAGPGPGYNNNLPPIRTVSGPVLGSPGSNTPRQRHGSSGGGSGHSWSNQGAAQLPGPTHPPPLQLQQQQQPPFQPPPPQLYQQQQPQPKQWQQQQQQGLFRTSSSGSHQQHNGQLEFIALPWGGRLDAATGATS